MASVINVSQIHYPESDGKPMGETDLHREAMVRHIELLKDYYAGQRVYVTGDLLVYYEQGNPRKFVVPDAFVVQGLAPKERRVFKIWVEGKVPDVVVETTSRKTRRKDTVDKPELYARLGIKEYFLFDPAQDYLDPPLQGHRLVGEAYERIDADAAGCLVSRELGLRLRVEEAVLQFYRVDTGERLLTRGEQKSLEAERADREAKRADREAEARRIAEAEVARLREELAGRSPPKNRS
jgi:Uma2 family endonuclease